ncbi:MAG: lipoyl synthase [Candidatus Helarchaeota archaeon]|nr:lipoyl synthase [Candidatus Helarchaeota archaeon]
MPKKPSWITTTVDLTSFQDLIAKIQGFNLHVVCFEASCPNIGTCFHKKTATFLILGNICTRNCKFCGIKHGSPSPPDPMEPESIAKLVKELKLTHVVITSVTRDDLPDQGVSQYIQTIREIKNILPNGVIEVLIPDFQGRKELLVQLIREKPEIVNHNVETVPRLYPLVRPQANYSRSLDVLHLVKERDPSIYTKSGLMIGVGETKKEVQSLLQDLRQVRCDIVTIGQYLQPSEHQIPVVKYYSPKEFKEFEQFGMDLGFLHVNAAPLVRSSYNAEEFSKQFL